MDLDCPRDSKTEILLALNQLLIRRTGEGRTTALIVDEAQNLDWNVLEEIRRDEETIRRRFSWRIWVGGLGSGPRRFGSGTKTRHRHGPLIARRASACSTDSATVVAIRPLAHVEASFSSCPPS